MKLSRMHVALSDIHSLSPQIGGKEFIPSKAYELQKHENYDAKEMYAYIGGPYQAASSAAGVKGVEGSLRQ